MDWWKAKSSTTMQGWDDCALLTTPTGTNFTQGPTLIDVRDNKTYEIRKFADGKCWMVDNLMYGGNIDACAGKSTFAGNGSATPSNRFGVGTYGDCRDPRVGGSAPCTSGSNACGYYYDWQAVMQHATAYFNTTYAGPTTNVQGICPEGWKVPSGYYSGDFQFLQNASGAGAIGFWQSPGAWKGFLSGFCNNSGGLANQGSYGYWWSSLEADSYRSYRAYLGSSVVDHATSHTHKEYGLALRCLKN